MNVLIEEVRHKRLLRTLAFVPVVIAADRLRPDAHVLLFFLSVPAIVPPAALLSCNPEAVAARTGDAAGGRLNAALGDLTELAIALTRVRAGEYLLVKASPIFLASVALLIPSAMSGAGALGEVLLGPGDPGVLRRDLAPSRVEGDT